MKDRARLSKRISFTSSNGDEFFGSKDFPKTLISSVQKWDPKGMLFGASDIVLEPSMGERERLGSLLNQKIRNKRLLVCSGAMDKLVPYHASTDFLQFLKKAATGWWASGNVYVEDLVYPNAGHE